MSELIYQAYAILVLVTVAVLVLFSIGGLLMAARVSWKVLESRRRRSAPQDR